MVVIVTFFDQSLDFTFIYLWVVVFIIDIS